MSARCRGASERAAAGAWVKAAKIKEGPLYRPVMRTGRISLRRLSARTAAELVKMYARRAGLKSADFIGHSTHWEAPMIWSTFVLDAARAIALVAAVNVPIAILILVLAGRRKVERR
jgi:hypothetical protein